MLDIGTEGAFCVDWWAYLQGLKGCLVHTLQGQNLCWEANCKYVNPGYTEAMGLMGRAADTVTVSLPAVVAEDVLPSDPQSWLWQQQCLVALRCCIVVLLRCFVALDCFVCSAHRFTTWRPS